MMDEDFLKEVFRKLTSGVGALDVPFLIEAYTKVGHLLAEAKAEADDAAAVRKHEYSKAFLEAKQREEKVTDAIADKIATVAVFGLVRREAEMERRVAKIRHLRESVYQALSSTRAGTIEVGE